MSGGMPFTSIIMRSVLYGQPEWSPRTLYSRYHVNKVMVVMAEP